MKLSVFYHHVLCAAQQQGVSVEEMLRRVRDLGIEYVELDLRDVQAVEPLARLLSGCGIKVSSVYGFYEWQKDPKAFQDWRQLECARFLGAGQVMVIPGLFSSHQETERNVQRQRMLEAMSVFCDRAAQAGYDGIYAIEHFGANDYWHTIRESARWLLERGL